MVKRAEKKEPEPYGCLGALNTLWMYAGQN